MMQSPIPGRAPADAAQLHTVLHAKLLASGTCRFGTVVCPGTPRSAAVPALQGPHFWDEAHSFQSYLDNFDGVAAAASADPRAVSGDASSNTFSYAVVGLRRVLALCFHRALVLNKSAS